jgi:hypothetical protein
MSGSGASMTRTVIALLRIALGFVGCASVSPAAGTPFPDVGAIAGKWSGTITPGYEPFHVTISPVGR